MQMLSSLLSSSLQGAFPRHDEELLLNVVAACTNITYYASQVRSTLVYVSLCIGTALWIPECANRLAQDGVAISL
jgi:hypothetical protein